MKTGKFLLILAAYLVVSMNTYGQKTAKVTFLRSDFEDIKGMMTSEGKTLLIEFAEKPNKDYNYLYNSVFNDEKVAMTLNDKFVLYHYNPAFDKRKKLKKRFKIDTEPAYVFVDANMNELYKLAGKFDKNDFLDAINFALMPDYNMHIWKKMIEEGSVQSDVYFNYAKGLYLAKEDYVNAADQYFKHSNTDFIKDPNGVEAVLLFVDEMYDPRFMILMENHNTLSPELTHDKFFVLRTNEVISNSLTEALASDSTISLEDTVNQTAEKFMIEDPIMLLSLVRMKYYSTVKNNKKEYYMALTDYVLTAKEFLDPDETLEYINEVVADCKDPEILMVTGTTLYDMIAKYNKPEFQKTLIDLSVKLKNYEEARHAFEVLRHFNDKEGLYSAQEMQELKNKIDKAQMVDKGLEPEPAPKEKQKKKKKRKR